MPNEIAAAMIGGGATLVATTVPLTWRAVANRMATHLSARRDVLLGVWDGKGTDYYVEDSRKPLITFDAVMTFKSVGHAVKADAVLRSVEQGERDEIGLNGMFYNEDYLQLFYHNKNLVRKQLGVVVLGLSSNGSTLRGYYTGFSPRRETIVAGTIVLEKKT